MKTICAKTIIASGFILLLAAILSVSGELDKLKIAAEQARRATGWPARTPIMMP